MMPATLETRCKRWTRTCSLPNDTIGIRPILISHNNSQWRRLRTASGHEVKLILEVTESENVLKIRAPSSTERKEDDFPLLQWGMHRTSLSSWYHPRGVVPAESNLDQSSGVMSTPMKLKRQGEEDRDCFEVQLQIPRNLEPAYFSFQISHQGFIADGTPVQGTHFTVPLGLSTGEPSVLGTCMSECKAQAQSSAQSSINFAVISRHAKSMSLVLMRAQLRSDGGFEFVNTQSGLQSLVGTGYLEIELDPVINKTGDCWHICVEGMRDPGSMCYAWRASGPEGRNDFHAGYLLLDPYATSASPVLLPEKYWNSAPHLPPYLDLEAPVLMGMLKSLTESFDWKGAGQPIRQKSSHGADHILNSVSARPEDAVICDVDILSHTRGPTIPTECHGKLSGILCLIPALLDAGVTAIIINPVLSGLCVEGHDPNRRLPMALFCPDAALSLTGPADSPKDLKEVIQACHSAGLEVLLKLDFCMTAESSEPSSGRLQGMRGISGETYYRSTNNGQAVLRSGHPVVRRMIVDCLHHWAQEYRVDGFYVLNAENLCQDQFGTILDSPSLAEELALDPVLRGLKLIAEAADTNLLPRQGLRGFPHWGVWAQCNDRFYSQLKSYLFQNQRGLLSEVATRITGSSDLFGAQHDSSLPGGLSPSRRTKCCINVLPASSIEEAHESSAGRAVELTSILKTMLLVAFTSAGLPCFPASIILPSLTSDNNNNSLLPFVRLLAAVRQMHRALLVPKRCGDKRDIQWHAAKAGDCVDWSGASSSHEANIIAYSLRGDSGHAVYVALNPLYISADVQLPPSPLGTPWRQVIDTGSAPPEDATLDGKVFSGFDITTLQPGAGALFLSGPSSNPRPS
ncbi:hypothetical protein CEUSTIGMA_g6916.t1 [Chlamydomonas eustigma]|uniref:Isoamylase 1-3-like C-terminal domain-containing protein n=1 Tax=Chlamydomonas eustigma TaxID=1157962 RepID=A0A250X8S6_9CHLO|nr:hypothetical protein CEUSTIGMA_g6916.t1 [Chlamydomonas eustigma]|eukprot:GAX79475.1 hypothetical protein CEUSTIGMA_g6916.t1 [Chlamydomonas eustigma]